MNEGLGKRICREYGWFALILFVLSIGCAQRLLPTADMRNSPNASQPDVSGR